MVYLGAGSILNTIQPPDALVFLSSLITETPTPWFRRLLPGFLLCTHRPDTCGIPPIDPLLLIEAPL